MQFTVNDFDKYQVMTKFKFHHPDPWFGIPVAMLPTDFDLSDYTYESFWLINNPAFKRVDFVFRWDDYQAFQDQPAAQLVRFAADGVSWSAEQGLTLIVDTNHMYINTLEGDWFVDDLPQDQQSLVPAGDVMREIFFAAWRMLGFTITADATNPV